MRTFFNFSFTTYYRVIKSRRMGWAEMGEMRSAYKILRGETMWKSWA
jgi:hypothetical protein